MPFEAEIRSLGIELRSYELGRHQALCPKCAHTRSTAAHRKEKKLYVTIEADKFFGGCNHCGWTFPEPGFREGNARAQTTEKPHEISFHSYGPKLRKRRHPFYWQHLNGKGEWEKGTGGIKTDTLLYRIDEVEHALRAGRAASVLIVEGEKDVDTAFRLGFAATCNAHGASQSDKKPKWTKAHSAQLRGANLVVLNDNDDAGRAHAEAVCATSLGIAASIRRLDLASHWKEVAPGDDISDWVERGGGTAEKLRGMIPFALEFPDPHHFPPPRSSPPPPQPTAPQLPAGPLDVSDFYGYAPEANYIFRHTGQRWPKRAIDTRLAKIGRCKASTWIDRNNSVEQMTWFPGEPTLIKDKLVVNGGWFEHKNATVFNLYRPANLKLGNPRNAQRWLEHVGKVYPDDATYLIKWFAHRCQHPGVKINHSLFLGGAPRIGKDTLLAPVRYTVGEWNCTTVAPTMMLARFNGFLKSVLLIVSEARDLGEINRPQFYEHMKQIGASPPPTLTVDEKNTHPYEIPNVVGIVITSNHKAGGIYLPANDARHYVAWSPLEGPDAFEDGYFDSLWQYLDGDGKNDVAAYLLDLDVSEFNPKTPPPRTPAFYEIVAASRAPEGSEMADVIDTLGNPECVTLVDLQRYASEDFANWLKDRRNRRTIGAHLETCGYIVVNNDFDRRDGQWKIAGRRQTVYAKSSLTLADQLRAVAKKRDNSI
jgi:hypothetical protein